MFSNVVLPEPEGPTIPTFHPLGFKFKLSKTFMVDFPVSSFALYF